MDFSYVRVEHLAIHDRLINWAKWVKPGRGGGAVHPMFRQYRHGYEEPAATSLNSIDGHAVEKLVVALPEKHRTAIQWAYVFPFIPVHRVRKHLGLTEAALIDLVHAGRTMLKNRSV